MSYKFVYDLPFVNDFTFLFLLPILLILFVLIAVLLIYSYEHRNDKDPIYKYKIDLYSLILTLVISIVFFVIILGFSWAFKVQMDETGLDTLIGYLVLLAPIVPAIIVLLLVSKIIKFTKNKPGKKEKKIDRGVKDER